MEGTIFISGIEIKAFFVVGLGITCCILILSTIIFYVLWIKEVIKQVNQSRKLLEDIKASFRDEISTAVDDMISNVKGIIPDFKRGRYSMVFQNAVSELSEEFSQGILSIQDGLGVLGNEIGGKKEPEKSINNENDKVEVETLISSISILVRNMGVLIGDYEVKNIDDAMFQCSERDRVIEGLRNNTEKLKQYVSKLNKSKEE